MYLFLSLEEVVWFEDFGESCAIQGTAGVLIQRGQPCNFTFFFLGLLKKDALLLLPLKGRQNLLPKYWIGLGLSPPGPSATLVLVRHAMTRFLSTFLSPLKKKTKGRKMVLLLNL